MSTYFQLYLFNFFTEIVPNFRLDADDAFEAVMTQAVRRQQRVAHAAA
jgi:hypothetical protein